MKQIRVVILLGLLVGVGLVVGHRSSFGFAPRSDEEVVRALQAALQRNPRDVGAMNSYGIEQARRGDLLQAIQTWRTALRVDPRYVHLYNNIGGALRRLGHLRESLAWYQASLQLQPTYWTWYNLGLLREDLGQVPEAMEAHGEAVRLFPGFSQARDHLGRLEREVEAREPVRLPLPPVTVFPEGSDTAGRTVVARSPSGPPRGAGAARTVSPPAQPPRVGHLAPDSLPASPFPADRGGSGMDRERRDGRGGGIAGAPAGPEVGGGPGPFEAEGGFATGAGQPGEPGNHGELPPRVVSPSSDPQAIVEDEAVSMVRAPVQPPPRRPARVREEPVTAPPPVVDDPPPGPPVRLAVDQGGPVFLTFDGGADADGIPAILAALRERGVHSTFFLTGQWVTSFPDLARRILAEGHEIANHSMTHPNMTGFGREKIADQLERMATAFREVAGQAPQPFFRFPFGAQNPRVEKIIAELGYQPVYWDIDTLDWKEPSVASILERVRRKLRRRSVILMHCGSRNGSRALPRILDEVMGRGYQPIKLSQATAGDLAALPPH